MTARAIFSVLRTGAWATPSRLRGYVIILLLAQMAIAAGMGLAFAHYATAHGGKPVATDFMTFWSAARLAVLHGGAAAYDDATRIALQRASGAMEPADHYAYWYPPPFLLLTLPLGLLPYTAAAILFLALGYLALWLALRRIAPSGGAALALLFSPVMLLNTLTGQNASFTCAIFGAALIWLDRRPRLAGAVLGLLVCKPHFAVLAPLLLLVSRRWRAFSGFAASATTLIAISGVALGPDSWLAFLSHSREAMAILQNYSVDWSKIQSVFAGARLLGASASLALLLQLALAAAVVTLLLWRHLGAWLQRPLPSAPRGEGASDMAMLAVAGLLAAPYMFDYDLVCLLAPMAYLLAEQKRSGPRSWELTLIAILYVLPILVRGLAVAYAIPLVPPALLAFLLVLNRRRHTATAAAPAPPAARATA
jgi:hypothetical protein